jgi:U3 small nucleolar RNA-associated protein 20
MVMSRYHRSQFCHSFVAFGLDLFNTAHRRNRFDYKDSKVIARLEPMSAVIGNTLYSDNGQVLINGVKAAVAISKCPLKSVEKALPVYVRQMMGILEQSGNTESELAQAALKSLASIIRTCASAKVKEKDLVRLLEVIMPDLEEPSRQASVFAMLRAIVSRKFVVPEIYDAMDKVAEIMVTSGTAQVQESCRGILLQFLLDYPQGKGRLANQMTFLAKNLSYVYENGRKSVMELLGAVISKFDPSLLNQYTDLLFVALVMVLANDESAKCREMSATIMQSLFSRMDPGHRQIVLSHLHAWASQRGQPRLCSVSAQVYGLFLDTLHSEAEGHATVILGDLNSLLGAFTSTGEPEIAEEDVEWRVPYHALVAAGKLAREMPAVLSGGVDWPAVSTYFLFPHAWVRLAACRLIGQLYSSVSASVPDPDLPESSPLSQAGMRAIATDLSEQLKSSNLDEALSLQAVKNLFYIGKCFAVLPFPASGQDVVDEDGESEDDEPADDGVANDGDESDNSHPLPWLFSRLSYQARSAHITRRNRAVPAVSLLTKGVACCANFRCRRIGSNSPLPSSDGSRPWFRTCPRT